MAALTTTNQPSTDSATPLPTDMRRARFLVSPLPVTPSTSVTTYFYRTTGGTRASLHVPADLPLGAVVEIVVTA